MSIQTKRIVITGAAGLVGQNLVLQLKQLGFNRIVGIDKHPTNTQTLRDLNTDIEVIEADLAQAGLWQDALENCDVLVLNHAQIGALTEEPFIANNVVATQRVLDAAHRHKVPYIVHISSSVVNSAASDFYTVSKAQQEQLVRDSAIPACILRPTLMFGWFDRKHLGWLARFMRRAPAFPVPGHGLFLRQPLYVRDFCNIIAACVRQPRPNETFNISGQEKIDYIDLIREVRSASGATMPIVRIPYSAFWAMLTVYGLFDRNPPFTTKQLKALVTPDVFEVIDWPAIFGIKATSLNDALTESYRHPVYSTIVLDF